MVRVSCMTFNHSAFIENAMNGFCMQQTNFPFVCTIIDDFSTDGEQQVINNYLQTYFDLDNNGITRNEETNDYMLIFSRHKSNRNCFFAVLFLKYNHYKKKSKQSYIEEWNRESKYFAICEGDDYWTDSSKLQKQVYFLESHPDFVMTCNRTLLLSVKKAKIIGERYCYNGDSIVKTKDVIYRTGNYISTCSIVYKKEILDDYPDYCRKCLVGDYPLQIVAAMKGFIYYFNDVMSVYRVDNIKSWIGQQKWLSADPQRLEIIKSRINMFRGFSKDYPQYKVYFNNKIADEIRRNMPYSMWDYEGLNKYISFFQSEIKDFSLFWKIDFYLRKTRLPLLNRYYYKSNFLFSHFSPHTLYYKTISHKA